MVVHESMRDGGALGSERWWCMIAREVLLHRARKTMVQESLRDGGA